MYGDLALTALSRLLLAALSGLLALLAGLLLPAAALLLIAVLAALLLLATALAALVGIIHNHSCEVKPPMQDNEGSQGMFLLTNALETLGFSAPRTREHPGRTFWLAPAHFPGRGTRKRNWERRSLVELIGLCAKLGRERAQPARNAKIDGCTRQIEQQLGLLPQIHRVAHLRVPVPA
jgi:hypothetical protein